MAEYRESYVTQVPRLQLGFEDAASALALPLSIGAQISQLLWLR